MNNMCIYEYIIYYIYIHMCLYIVFKYIHIHICQHVYVFSINVCMCIYIYIYNQVHTYVYIYIIYILILIDHDRSIYTQLGKSVDQANTQERRRKVYLLTELCTGGDLKLGDNDWVWMVW